MAIDFKTGSIIQVALGAPPEEVQGHEQGYERPCVIIKAVPQLKLAVVVPCTTKEPTYRLYAAVKLPQGTAGLTRDSYVLCHQIRTISFERVLKPIGNLDDKNMLKIKHVLADFLEL